jgi:hypothetical protein
MAKPSVYVKQSVQFKSAHENRWHDRQMEHTQVRPKKRNYMDLRVEMIPLIATDRPSGRGVGGKPVDMIIYRA